MQSTQPIYGTSQTTPPQRKSHALIFVINLILLLGVIACACAPLSQSVKYITTFSGIGGILLIDVIYCAVIYACDRNTVVKTDTPPLPRKTFRDGEFIRFLEKAGFENAGKYHTLALNLKGQTTALDAFMKSPLVPQSEISLIHDTVNRDTHYWLYFPSVKMALHRRMTNDGDMRIYFSFLDIDEITGDEITSPQDKSQEMMSAKFKELLGIAMRNPGKEEIPSTVSSERPLPYRYWDFRDFLTKAGLKNVDRKFPIFDLTLSQASSLDAISQNPQIPKDRISLIRDRQHKYRLYLPKANALLTPHVDDGNDFFVTLFCPALWPIKKGIYPKDFDAQRGNPKNNVDALKSLIAAEQR